MNVGFFDELKILMDKHNIKSISPVNEKMFFGYLEDGEFMATNINLVGKTNHMDAVN